MVAAVVTVTLILMVVVMVMVGVCIYRHKSSPKKFNGVNGNDRDEVALIEHDELNTQSMSTMDGHSDDASDLDDQLDSSKDTALSTEDSDQTKLDLSMEEKYSEVVLCKEQPESSDMECQETSGSGFSHSHGISDKEQFFDVSS